MQVYYTPDLYVNSFIYVKKLNADQLNANQTFSGQHLGVMIPIKTHLCL
jgi:hypothetical protein